MKIKFIQQIIDKLRGKKHQINTITEYSVLKKPFTPPKKTYKNLIAIQGFGHSGSGALLDLLTEFENTTVLGSYDKDGSQSTKASAGEVDFVRRYGGVLDLEAAFTTRNNNIRDFKLKNFITLIEYFYKNNPFYNDQFMKLTNDFIESLVDFKLETNTGCDENQAFMFQTGFGLDYSNLKSPFLFEHKKTRYMYYLKELTVEQYRNLANNYIKKIFLTVESEDNLILDQFVSDDNTNFDTLREYLGEFKHLAVYRDPRDVYATGIILGQKWIPSEAETFVKWYKYHTLPYVNAQHKDFMIIRFEDLVLNYDAILPQIYNFLNIDKNKHTTKKSCFNPLISAKNIGIYKNLQDQKTIEYIYKELTSYCYKNHD